MMYLFIKRFIPVLFIGIIIYLILFVSYVGVFQVTSFMIDQKAHEIREKSTDDVTFANNVRTWVWERVKPSDSQTNSHMIQPPEISYLTGQGDCSERSLLMTRMLNYEGIKAHSIRGAVGPIGHQTVEYTVNGTTRIIDIEQFPTFTKSGDGIQSIEYVYDVYWFIPWRSAVG